MLALLNKAEHQMSDVVQALLLLADLSQEQPRQARPLNVGQHLQHLLNNRMALLIQQHLVQVHCAENWPQINVYPPWLEELWALLIKRQIKQAHHSSLSFAWSQHDGYYQFTLQCAPQQAISANDLSWVIVQGLAEKLNATVGMNEQHLYIRLPSS